MPQSIQTIRCFILVKAYPQPSQKYQETVCVAAISEDGKQLLRLYPIRFRHLPDIKKFTRGDLVEMRVSPADNDPRPESFKVDESSIEVLIQGKSASADSKASLWMGLAGGTLTELKEEWQRTGKSLGIVKPDENSIKFYYKRAKDMPAEDADLLKGIQAQTSLFDVNVKPLDPIEYLFYLKFTSGGFPHDMQIHDWEAQETFRQYKRTYKDTNLALEKMNEFYGQKLLTMNPHFIFGNLKNRPYQFMIIGVLRTSSVIASVQTSLF